MNIPLGAPEKPQDSLFYRTDISPEEVFQAIGRLRKEARDEIDRLIRFLDDTDDHMEREPDDEEDDREGDDVDEEPSLGFLENHPSCVDESSGGGWPYYSGKGRQHSCQANSDDCEGDEHDGREPDDDEGADGYEEDAEPSLGSPCDHHGGESQLHWGSSALHDREQDDAESGIADMDGLLEQVGSQNWQQGGMV